MSRTASIDSSLAGPMKLHVFTTRTSATAGSSTSACPRRARTPSMTSLSTWFFGQPSVTRWTRRGVDACVGSLTEVGELKGDAQVALAEQRHDGLQVVALLPAHAELVALDRHLDLQLRVLHELHDLARLVARDALLEIDALLGRSRGAGLHRPGIERLQRYLTAREALAQDVPEGPDLPLVRRTEVERRLLPPQLGGRVPEVEALPHLAERLLDGVVDLLKVDPAHHVERRHRGAVNRRGGE